MPSKAMVLAAGLATRLRPLNRVTPKCMVRIGGKPLLEHSVVWLSRHGVTDLVINLCSHAEQVIDHFGDGRRWRMNIIYSIEETPLGTAGGLRAVKRFFRDSTFLVWYGDNLTTCRLDHLFELHRTMKAIATMALYYRDDPSQSGIAELDDRGRITRFVEKPGARGVFSHWVNAGLLVLEPEVLEAIPAEGNPDLGRDVLPSLLQRGDRMYGYRMSGSEGLWWVDTPEDLRQVRSDWRRRQR